MQAKKRYILVLMSCAFLVLCYFGAFRLRQQQQTTERPKTKERSYLDGPGSHYPDDEDLIVSPSQRRSERRATHKSGNCTLHTCFDFTRCQRDFKVFVYPAADGDPAVSPTYQKILNAIRDSGYYTPDPGHACLFVLAIDTLDRDSLSPDYVPDLQSRLDQAKYWNNGRNHVIFNLYSGTWPDYAENLGFDIGEAILAKASMSVDNFRPQFDVSIPLFSKSHPEKGGGDRGYVGSGDMPATKKYLLVFKGKRYLYGIGSETRNSLYHLHNAKDIILLTTCKHGKKWKEMKDQRCELENKEYDRYDYQVLLQNATFCLVPRGRRLGSFRFLESLQAGCVPVLLSNGWELPFGDVLDWTRAAVWADERLLLQVPDMIRSIPATRVHAYRQQTQVLWDDYFSSVEKIVAATFEIIRERVRVPAHRSSYVWNSHPGALPTLPQFSDVLRDFPFHLQRLGEAPLPKFTAVIYVSMAASASHASPLLRLVRTVAKSENAARVVVIWNSESVAASSVKWPTSHIPINVIQAQHKTISSRFFPHPLIQTDAVLSLDEDVLLTTEELDFAFRVWRSFPERIVGYPARSHFWDDSRGCWGYTSKWTNDYSMVLTGAAFYHRYYHFLYTHHLSDVAHKIVDQSQNCEDILLNFLVSHVTRLPPIKVTQRKQYKETMLSAGARGSYFPSPWNDPDHFVQRQTCVNAFAKVFGYMPLVRSSTRLDPVLFKDPVSNLRKKYRRMEVAAGS